MSLLRGKQTKSMRDISCVLKAKDNLKMDTPLSTPLAPKSINILKDSVDRGDKGFSGWINRIRNRNKSDKKEDSVIRPSLSMTSRMSYFQDRLLSPELMRAMALLYLNGSPIPYNVTEDMYLSPALTVPLEILEKFPPVYFITGEILINLC
jgi:hypothetical protein